MAETDGREMDEEDDPDPTTVPTARGILRGYFADAESVRRFLEGERRAWAERERELEKLLSPTRPHKRTADG
jgi:hypothetical protein